MASSIGSKKKERMCSSTSKGSSSGGGSGSGGGSRNGGGFGQNSKPENRQKVPKRGPGVAELEKILREQENNGKLIGETEGSSFPSVVNRQYYPQSYDFYQLPLCLVAAPVTPPPAPLVFVQNGMVQNAGSVVALPENAFIPGIWFAHGTNVHGEVSHPNSMRQRTDFHYPSMATATLAGIRHDIELLSSQRCYNHTQSMFHDQGKMVGRKRPYAYFMNEHQNEAPTFSPQINSSNQFHHDFSHIISCRPDCSFHNYDSPTLTRPSQMPQAVQFHQVDKLTPQETQQKSEANGFVQNNYFNGMSSPTGQLGKEENNEESNEWRDGIDLELKL